MNNEPNRPAEELTEKELDGVVGGAVEFAGKGDCEDKEFHVYKDNIKREFDPRFPK